MRADGNKQLHGDARRRLIQSLDIMYNALGMLAFLGTSSVDINVPMFSLLSVALAGHLKAMTCPDRDQMSTDVLYAKMLLGSRHTELILRETVFNNASA